MAYRPNMGRPPILVGTLVRTSVAWSPDVDAAVRAFCKARKLSMTAYVEAAVLADLKARGLL